MAVEQDNGTIVRRFLERVWNGGDLDAIKDLVDDQFTNFGVRQSGAHAAMRHIVTAWRTAFPDLRYEILEEIVHGDKVVHRVIEVQKLMHLCGSSPSRLDQQGHPFPYPWRTVGEKEDVIRLDDLQVLQVSAEQGEHRIWPLERGVNEGGKAGLLLPLGIHHIHD